MRRKASERASERLIGKRTKWRKRTAGEEGGGEDVVRNHVGRTKWHSGWIRSRG